MTNKTGVIATATIIDANLSNPWGLATAPGLPFWIADNNANVASLYSGTGTIETSAVTGSNATAIAIPASAAGVAANPTGQVYNGKGGFEITTSKGEETALFIFDGEGGTIAAWAQDSGATVTGITPQWKNDTTNYLTLNCRVEATGDLGTLSRFVYDIEKGPLGLKLDSVEFSTHDNFGQQLTLGLQVSGLALTTLK